MSTSCYPCACSVAVNISCSLLAQINGILNLSKFALKIILSKFWEHVPVTPMDRLQYPECPSLPYHGAKCGPGQSFPPRVLIRVLSNSFKKIFCFMMWFCIFTYLCTLWLCCVTCKILVPQPGMEPTAPALEGEVSLNHWTTREAPIHNY